MFKEEDRQRWQGTGDRMRSSMHGYRCRFYPAGISPAMAAVDRGIAVQEFFPVSTAWRAEAIIGTRHRGKIAHDENDLVSGPAFSDQTDDARFRVPAVNPFDAGGIDIAFME